VIGAISGATSSLRLGTSVTCPTVRYHPAIVAQAAATCAAMMEGRFFLGVGSGEALNEHITGERWPSVEVRQDMLEEAIDIIRLLWQGGQQDFYGQFYTVENARLYTLPEQPVDLMVAASGPRAARLAARSGDGLIATMPEEKLVREFDEAGGSGPKYGSLSVCWAETEAVALETVMHYWPIAGMKGPVFTELALPRHFEAVAEMVREEDIAAAMPCGPDVGKMAEAVRKYEQAGYTHVFFHQIGPNQEGFFRFWREELEPALQRQPAQAR
jgi:G6PDH family F420-dependent oxidoreductase